MIKDKRVPVFIVMFACFFILFENSIVKIVSLNQASLIGSENPILKFEIVKNYGAAWGIFQNSRLFLILFGLFVLILALYYGIKKFSFNDKVEVLSLALFLSGTFGNLIERIKDGYVTDYIKLVFMDFPIFNIFDAAIVTGIFLFIVSYALLQRSKK